MIALAFFTWWYGRGWNDAAHSLTKRIDSVNRAFSVRLLTRTLFSPWRRIITPQGSNIADHFRAIGDNIVSRVIGFVVRLIVLFAAFMSIIVISIASVIELIIWPLLPPAILICIVLGITQ
jgi:hypothetical protein